MYRCGMATRKIIRSIDELIDHYGGLSATGEALHTTPQNVWNWRFRGNLPTKQHYAHQQILKRHGLKAPTSLWGMVEAAE